MSSNLFFFLLYGVLDSRLTVCALPVNSHKFVNVWTVGTIEVDGRGDQFAGTLPVASVLHFDHCVTLVLGADGIRLESVLDAGFNAGLSVVPSPEGAVDFDQAVHRALEPVFLSLAGDGRSSLNRRNAKNIMRK